MAKSDEWKFDFHALEIVRRRAEDICGEIATMELCEAVLLAAGTDRLGVNMKVLPTEAQAWASIGKVLRQARHYVASAVIYAPFGGGNPEIPQAVINNVDSILSWMSYQGIDSISIPAPDDGANKTSLSVDDGMWVESDYARGYREGYERRDAEVRGAI